MRKIFQHVFLISATLANSLPVSGQAPGGHDLYNQYCATCHGSDVRGGLGPSLVDDVWIHGANREAQFAVVNEGVILKGMPPFGSVLGAEQIGEILDFIEATASDPSLAPNAALDTLTTLDYAINVEIFLDSLEIPWAIDFTSPSTALVVERPGRLWVVENGRKAATPVSGTPEVLHEGQGGMLDVAVDPDYAQNQWLYLVYSHVLQAADGQRPLAMTRLVRGRIHDNQWTDQEVLFEAPHETYHATRHHYGSRIVFDRDGYLFFSIGDRGVMENAQDLTRPNGKIHRIHRDGSIPIDNPFVSVEGALPSIYSYGHRNPQGLVIHSATGELWAAEHGPLGGDELNVVIPGRNYGWPVISYGINYNGEIITEHRRRPGMEQPIFYWRPSIAVSGLACYDGEAFPRWRGMLLVSALAYEEVRLIDIEGHRVMHDEVVLKGFGRVREAVTGRDGAVYAVLNDPHRIVRLTPREERIRGRL